MVGGIDNVKSLTFLTFRRHFKGDEAKDFDQLTIGLNRP